MIINNNKTNPLIQEVRMILGSIISDVIKFLKYE